MYKRSGFNQNGDFVAHLGMPKIVDLSKYGKKRYRYWEGIERLNNTNKLLEGNNSRCFFMFPNYPESLQSENKVEFEKLEANIMQNLEMETIGNINSFVMPDSLFFDTKYHLLGKGRDIRTKKLIELLKENQHFTNTVFNSQQR